MKKIISNSLKIGAVLALLFLCLIPMLTQKSSGVKVALVNEISEDVDRYYNSVKNNHQFNVVYTSEQLDNKGQYIKDLINYYQGKLGSNLEQLGSAAAVWKKLSDKNNKNGIEVDGSAKPSIVAGYIGMKLEVDKKIKEVATEGESNISAKDKNGVRRYYEYTQCAAPEYDESNRYSKTFLNQSRAVKKRVEQLILVYRVTDEAKYLAALRKEITDVAKWGNYWKSNQYIDTAEVAYAVSLGYSYLYGALTPAQRCVIENRLLYAVLLYGLDAFSSMNTTFGNFNQVGHSGAGIAALTLIDSSSKGSIKVVNVDKGSHTIMIEYPVKTPDGETDVSIRYESKLYPEEGDDSPAAKISDKALYNILMAKYGNLTAGQTIPLRGLYSAVIARTTDYLPKVLKSDNMYIDGTYPEGNNYFLYGMSYFGYYLATLNNTLHKDYSMLNFQNNKYMSRYILNNIVLNPIYLSNANGSNSGNYAYGDGSYDTRERGDDLFYFANISAEKNGYVDSAKAVYDFRKRTAPAFWAFHNIMAYNEGYDAKDELVDYEEILDKAYYRNEEITKTNNVNRLGISAFRNTYTDPNGIYVAMKGGYTGDNHTHLDLGSYIYDAMGTRWIVEAGSQYDGTKYHDKDYLRWQYYVARAEAHSTMVINAPGRVQKNLDGTALKYGTVLAADQWKEARATFEKFESSKESNFSIVDLTNAYNRVNNDDPDDTENKQIDYGSSSKISVMRGLKFYNHKKYVLVQDEVTNRSVLTFYSFLNVANGINVTITQSGNNAGKEAILDDGKGNQVKVILKAEVLKPEGASVNISLRKIDDITKTIPDPKISKKSGLVDYLIADYEDNEEHSHPLRNHVNLNLNERADDCKKNKPNDEGKCSVNHNKLAVYFHNSKEVNMTFRIGVFYVPIKNGNKEESVDESLIKMSALSTWYIPGKPTVKVVNDDNEVKNNDTIKGKAVIKFSSADGIKDNEVLKYSLDGGKNWYVYDEKNSTDVRRRTYSDLKKYNVSVLAYLDDGAGMQGDTTEYNVSFTIEPSETYTINKYTVDEDKSFIDMVDAKTTLNVYKGNITLGPNYRVEIDLGDKNYIYSGSVAKIYNGNTLVKQYTNIVRGDINGDGMISSLDYVKVKSHIMNTKQITGDALKKAADANQDGKISSLDYVRIKNVIMNGG